MDADGFEKLMAKAQGGDAEALDALFRRHESGVRAFVRIKSGALLRAKEESADIVQSACREALRDIGNASFADEGDFKAWLMRVAWHKIHRKSAFYGAERRTTARERNLEVDEVGRLAFYAANLTPSRDAEATEEMIRVERAFDALPEDYRDLLVEIAIVGRDRRELAIERGQSEAALRQSLTRARARLALLLRRPAD